MAVAEGDRTDPRTPRAADAPVSTGRRRRANPPRRPAPLVVGRIHDGPPLGSGSDLVSEAATQVGIARLRAGINASRPALAEATIQAALADVPDPELPMLSVVDL